MFALPLIGWGMLSAGHYPIVMFGPVHLPAILPQSSTLYAVLRKAHTILAYLLFLTFLAHLSAVLFHTMIVRDRLLDRMALWPTGPETPKVKPEQKAPVPKDAVPGAGKVPRAGAIAASAAQTSVRPVDSQSASAGTAASETPGGPQSDPAPASRDNVGSSGEGNRDSICKP
jgi:hypothetical protein